MSLPSLPVCHALLDLYLELAKDPAWRVSNARQTARGALISTLANEFSRMLLRDIGPDKLSEAIARNAAESNPDVCHTHDFCDSNQSMLDAWRTVFGDAPAFIDDKPDDVQAMEMGLVNDAWNMAKTSRFYL